METITTESLGQLMFEATLHTHAVSRLDDLGQWIELEYFSSHHDAKKSLDRWTDKYPNSIVDITTIPQKA